MTIHKFPVAIWTDLAGNVTARTVDGANGCAVSTDDVSATRQLKRFLTWYYKRNPYETVPDFKDAVVGELSVPIRAQHVSPEGRFPSETIVNMPFQYVWGKRSDGSVACCLPLLDCWFGCSKPSSLKSLIHDEVRQCFAEATTSSLARAIEPSTIRLTTISLRIDSNNDSSYPSEISILPEIAIALGEKDSRRQFSQAWNRKAQVFALKDQLRNKRTNVLLVGDSGIGKTTIVAETVRQIQKEGDTTEEDSRKTKRDPRFWLTNASRLIAGMQYLGQWEQRVEQMIDELSEIRGVLCIENLLQLVQTGSSEPQASLAAFFRHFMLNDELQMVSECTPHELEAVRRLLPGFDSMFHIINVRPMNIADSLSVLTSIADQFYQNKKINVEQLAVSACQHLFQRFMPYDGFPGKCVVFWKQLLQEESEAGSELLTTVHVIEAFVAQTGLPEFLVRDELKLDIDDVIQYFEQRIVGQPEACEAVSQLVIAFKAAMNDPARPIGIHLFCGPTGVGKTEMAKTLAEYLFGAGHKDERSKQVSDRLVRLDMSEYAAPGSAEKLLIDQHGQPSKLVQKIRQIPFVVLLLDEIEKAAPEVFDALMTVFDEGRMVDRLGREANFCSSVIILTSNLGTANADPIGFDSEAPAGFEKEVRSFFRPEFFNRLDKVITFDHLDEDSIFQIAQKEIRSLEKREGLEKRNLKLECSAELIQHVARLGYDRRLGARPLQRTIENQIVTPLARWLTENPDAQFGRLDLGLDGTRVSIRRSP